MRQAAITMTGRGTPPGPAYPLASPQSFRIVPGGSGGGAALSSSRSSTSLSRSGSFNFGAAAAASAGGQQQQQAQYQSPHAYSGSPAAAPAAAWVALETAGVTLDAAARALVDLKAAQRDLDKAEVRARAAEEVAASSRAAYEQAVSEHEAVSVAWRLQSQAVPVAVSAARARAALEAADRAAGEMQRTERAHITAGEHHDVTVEAARVARGELENARTNRAAAARAWHGAVEAIVATLGDTTGGSGGGGDGDRAIYHGGR